MAGASKCGTFLEHGFCYTDSAKESECVLQGNACQTSGGGSSASSECIAYNELVDAGECPSDCAGGQILVDCAPPEPDDNSPEFGLPTCENPHKRPNTGGKRGGGASCTAKCICPYWDKEPLIWEEGTLRCIREWQCPSMSTCGRSTNTQDEGQWCNNGERKNNKAVCEDSYARKPGGLYYPCVYLGANRCKAGEDPCFKTLNDELIIGR